MLLQLVKVSILYFKNVFKKISQKQSKILQKNMCLKIDRINTSVKQL